MSDTRYPKPIVVLHWATLAMILVALFFICWRDYFSPSDATGVSLMSLHMSAGLVVWFLTCARLFYRLKSDMPPPFPSSPLMSFAERSVHLLIYLFLLVMPLIGLASAWIRGRPFSFFGLFAIPSPLVTVWTSPTGKWLEHVHMDAAYIFLILAAIHALAAIYHHAVLGDNIMPRMMSEPRQKRV